MIKRPLFERFVLRAQCLRSLNFFVKKVCEIVFEDFLLKAEIETKLRNFHQTLQQIVLCEFEVSGT